MSEAIQEARWQDEREDDGALAPARGILTGVALSSGLWVGIVLAVWNLL